MKNSVYENMTALGRRFGYSMRDMADAMGVSLGTMYHRRKDPDSFTLRELRAFSEKTGITIAELLMEDTERKCSVVLSKDHCRCCEKEMPFGGCGCLRKGTKRHDNL